jgi:head-tail adaptor
MAVNAERYRHPVEPQTPTRTKSTDGGYTSTWAAVSGTPWWCSIEDASEKVMERFAGAGTLSTATHVLEGRYHSAITTKCRIVYGARTFSVRSVQNVNEADEVTRLGCEEVLS